MTRIDNSRVIRSPRGTELSAKSWLTEAPLRMLMNNLDPDVAEKPGELVVYGGIGRAARTWEDFDRIVASLRSLEADETLLVQSGKPVGIFRTHPDAPRVLIANSNLVPAYGTSRTRVTSCPSSRGATSSTPTVTTRRRCGSPTRSQPRAGRRGSARSSFTQTWGHDVEHHHGDEPGQRRLS